MHFLGKPPVVKGLILGFNLEILGQHYYTM